MDHDREKRWVSICTFGCLGVGAILGCGIFLICVLWTDCPVMEYGLEDFQVAQMLNVSQKEFVTYICKRRFLQWCCFGAVWCISSYYIAAGGYNLFVGGYYGFLAADLFIKFGACGLFYSLVCFLPHYMFSFYAVYCIGKWFAQCGRQEIYYYNRVNKMQYFVKIIAIILCVVFALIIEIKYQKNILNYFYQYLV